MSVLDDLDDDSGYSLSASGAESQTSFYRPIVSWAVLAPYLEAAPAAPVLSPAVALLEILVPIDDKTTFAKGQPTDPDTFAPGQSQWHLVGTWGLHADRVWNDYTGSGIMVGVLDDGFQYTHWDISANYRTDLDRDVGDQDNDPAPTYSNDNHGTSVIGTIIADDNGTGGVGVAFDAQAYGIRMDFQGGGGISETVDGFQYAHSTGLDVMNNSWGYTTPFADTTSINFAGEDFIDITNAMRDLVEDGRGGLGSNIVFAAGNDRMAGDNVNYHNMQNSIYVISVGAMDSDGTYSAFSTPGAAILVAAGGTSVWVPDRTGASGYNGSGDYTNFSGTSAAAPITSGAIAVMLEANEDLGWRDVQEILAYSAQHNDAAGGSWQYNGASNWNGGGLHFSHDYGFGAVDLHRAVRLAETWDLQQTSSNMTTLAPVTNSTAVSIPATGTITSTINITNDIEIEKAIIDLNISHARAGDLIVTLISPDGTESILIDRPVNGTFTSIYSFSGIDFVTTSNAHWGENSAGTWTLEIQDVAGGNSGTLNNWSLSFVGNTHTTDDLYVYTSDYGNFSGGALAARSTLTDTGGTDTINLSTLLTDTTLNMNGGTNSTVAGNTLTIAAGTVIERAYMGDGDDTVIGNSANNMIDGGRGDDAITGSSGNDTINGGAGTDTLTYLETIANFTFNFINSLTVHISHVGTVWTDIVSSVENFIFNDGTYTFAELQTYAQTGGEPPVTGTAANDTLTGSNSTQVFNAGNGNDRVFARDGNDTLNGEAGDDILFGENGDDTMNGGTGNDQFYGGAGTDTALYSVNSAGFIIYRDNTAYITVRDTNGTYGIDRVYNDVETIEFADVTIDLSVTTFALNGEGWGNAATVTGTAAADTMFGTVALDTIYGGNGNDSIYGRHNDDTLYGEAGNDRLYGEDGDDTLYGGAGDDLLFGGAGNDIMSGGAGNDQYYGGAGTDTTVVSALSSNFLIFRDNTAFITLRDKTGALGTSRVYNDVEFIQFNDTTINLTTTTFTIGGTVLGSADIISGTGGNDTLFGNAMNDTIHGGAGNDRLYGRAGDDTINGDEGDDYLYGEAGNDILNGGNGNDFLLGGDGNDRLNGGLGNDSIDGGNGLDTAVFSANSTGFIIFRNNTSFLTVQDTNNVYGRTLVYNNVESIEFNDITLDLTSMTFALNGAGWGQSSAPMTGTASNDTMTGTVINDTILGLDGHDTLSGRAGNDRLEGGLGNDKLYGEDGDDILIGGAGADLLIGGAGNDVFGFDSLGTGVDTVSGYALGDRFNITDLLSGYSHGVSDISQFVQARDVSGGTIVAVSATGTGTSYVDAFYVQGTALLGQDAASLLSANILIANQSL